MIIARSIESIWKHHKDELIKTYMSESIEQVWKNHKTELVRFYLSEKNKPITHTNLEHRYTDLNAKQYFVFPKKMSLPLDRMGMLMKYIQYLGKGLSPQEDEEIDRLMGDAVEQGMKNPKVKAGAIISTLLLEKEKRRKLCFHTNLFYDYLCVQLVREDENPFTFDSDIHNQKTEQMSREQGGGNLLFFFRMPELKRLSDSLKYSENDIERLSEESLTEIKVLKEKITYLRGLLPISQNTKGTSPKPS